MITLMRRYRKSLQVGLLFVVAAFVASLFVFGTRGFDGDGSPDTVATVNGERIPLERYQRRYQAYYDAYAQIYRERFSSELAERLGLAQQVVNDLVQETLVVQRARAEGLELSDEELNARVQAVPAFQEGGRFVLKRYEEFLRRRGLGAAAFEEDIRRELTRARVEAAVRGGVKVSEVEIEQAFAMRREEVRAAWALVDLGPLVAAATATDAELQDYLAKHGDEFRQPERRRVQYVLLAQKDFAKPVPEAEAERYYAAHPKEFESPRQVRAAHVLARVPETGGSAAEDTARAKIADVIRRAKAGEDFAKLAKELSEDPGSAPNGGDLGLVSPGEVVPQFEQALFALKKGEVSAEPVRTPFGFHAIKALDVRAGGRKPLKDVAAAIRERLGAEAAEAAARARAEALRPELQAAKDFDAAAKKLGLTPLASTLARNERLAGLGVADPLEDAAFALAVGGVSAPVKTPTGLVVLKAVEALPAGVPPLAEIKTKVAVAAQRQKAEAVAAERARQLATDARAGDFAAAAKKAGALTGETPRFSRAKPAEKLPGDAQVAALETPTGHVTAPVKTPQGSYVLKVLERVAPDTSGLATEREKIQRELLGRKQSLAWESWIAAARQGAKIEVSSRLPGRRRG
ncbi:MAG: hypothetical protein A3E31_01950 [Candidatus Rokubacteria bacterium RIFCSPHIGHO2_12_FULL_73_22]|nr:MAG: hypothetical protein A3D33_13405 [Candidatus Rokubacteria bacterium RIFCSPHIGHO2_02_FULL_73_26]OGK98690.1 MAG: hypothetical protein A3E31_01950 [Candidatus Rokubacteria bacterium RIFCSPHIGHO2_12_FULL_73_22]OGL11040.1 MAG: hypothetical protein A3I14_11290 [Candidatus Rokubacteria bacterium RIFCSPLOWO2_02_FULL_73_56]OGL29962.1 MAG: hypothetical protein A3G44_07825 [Candidatus Rokubacteria bacterium RIFCSPLOWO2_12_FULL_73_47]